MIAPFMTPLFALLLALLALPVVPAGPVLLARPARGPVDLAQAERAYHAGHYEEALREFEAALQDPRVPPGPVLYDLGNCAYRLGRHAEAIWYYRRAMLRLPRDEEVRFNLGLAQRQLGLEVAPPRSLGAAVMALTDGFTPDELLLLVVGLESAGLFGWVLLRRRRLARGAVALLVLLALLGAARLVRDRWFAGPPAGIVLAHRIELHEELHREPHSAPRAGPVTFELAAGEPVQVDEIADAWIRVVHAKGTGWTQRAGVGLVD